LAAHRIVVIGASHGGVAALETLLPGLSPALGAPVCVVQHRSRGEDTGLCEFLRGHSRLPVVEPNDKDEVVGGRVYLAPRDYHLLVERGRFALSVDAPVTFARPSIDVLFESAADAYGAACVGVVLTGANRDGARGLARIKARGGYAVVQDPREAASRVMPEAALAAAKADRVAPLAEIAPLINGLCLPAREVA
jgi:two-component system, chemotaxis family, protein-glutamate methylesterase/glutaminase